MIRDLSESLEQLVLSEVSNVQVEFDRPTDPYTPTQSTINLFLYDIRENVELRSNEPVVRRQDNQSTIEPPPLRVACSYLATAWPISNTDVAVREHHLLSELLSALSKFPTLPPQFLQGSLVGQEPPLPMITASADGLPNPAEFWTAIGNRLRASILLSVTLAMDMFEALQVPSVTTVRASSEILDDPGTREESFRIVGTVRDGAGPLAEAVVTLVESGRAAMTNSEGEYSLGPIGAGNVTLRVTKDAVTQDFNVTVPQPLGDDYDLQLP